MSVAQYLDAAHPPFDVVVFDEASQIPVWDAIGAIARGKQAVIVGDPKQLPPTSFFHRMEDDDEEATEAETVEDLESILDDCISARIPWLPLDWHYRSRHESLITFSNYQYYDNRLLTFPSPQREGMGVSWRFVPGGVYDKGKSRTNRAEADAVVTEVVRRLKNPERSHESIGVVTFSEAQQTLIEDLLEVARRGDSTIDAFFAEDVPESVFVKNLENVQGDERDVILFSICYGPDALGRVSMNFGPMNREGGERRLNVAITRARREVLVFSTLRADQIDLTRTRARGVRDLKTFLEYAERGPSAIAEAARYDSAADFDSPFEKAVHAALVERGWQVHQQVGCSGYRIDLAVVDPDAPGRYLLGIECDGANYHRAKTARDRDKLREGVLRDLGWRLHRIWSTDWWTNPEREIAKAVAAIEAARREPDRDHQRPTEPAAAPPQPTARVDQEPEGCRNDAPATADLPMYSLLPVGRPLGTPETFYEPAAAARIRRMIGEVVEHEGPIRLELAARRIATCWGFARVRGRALERIRALIPKDRVQVRTAEGSTFLWAASQTPGSYEQFRVPGGNPDLLRDAEELPPEEVANAALHLLRQHISAPRGDLARETSRLFGFQRTGANVEARMAAGIQLLVETGRARMEGDNVVITPTTR
jgi:very-short-patch-repair endonuclease